MIDFEGDHPSRRTFLRQGTVLGLGLGALSNCTASSEEGTSSGELALHDRARAFASSLGLRYPIVQAGMGGAAGPELATAVANAGALGGLGLTPVAPSDVFDLVSEVRAATDGAFFVNYILNFPPTSLDQALEAGAPVVQFSWGLPTPEMLRRVRNAGAKVGLQVTSPDGARAALALEPDYLVCQGIEAGGHVHASSSLEEALEGVLAEGGDTPVVAAGGISTGHDIRHLIQMGAAGAVLGTRFVATSESAAHPDYKQALVGAEARDTVFTICLNKGWPNATHRILRNETVKMWEAAGCPQPGSRPGEEDIVAYSAGGRGIERYRLDTPVLGQTGDVMALGVYAGTGVGGVRDVPPAGEVVARLWVEYLDQA